MPEEFPLYFIPQTAKTCPAQDVGCDEFTNLDIVAQGGEGIEYYSYLRQCQKPNQNTRTYYTWEGSDTQGYQLKIWSLIKNTSGIPYQYDENGDGDFNDPQDLNDPTPEGPAYVEEFSEFSRCSESVFKAGYNPHCREFYDEEGNKYYRLEQYTITSSENCHPYRKSIPRPLLGYKDQASCQGAGFEWTGDQCVKRIYYAIPEEGRSCRKENVGCREYIGNAGWNFMEVISDDFEKGSTAGWEGSEIFPVNLSNESIKAGGHSLYIPVSSQKEVFLNQGKTYYLEFWAKATSGAPAVYAYFKSLNPETNQIEIKEFFTPTSQETENTLSLNWRPYFFGPLFLTRPPTALEYLEIRAPQAFFLDNIVLKEITDDLFLIKNSWQTPASCDRDNYGYYAPQEQLGCRLYTDRAQREFSLKSFERLCRKEAVGCQLVINTWNSSFPFQKEFNKENTSLEDDLLIKEDSFETWVVDQKKMCQEQNKGCRALGKPVYLKGEFSQAYNTLYLKDNPDQYDDLARPILCQEEELFCDEYGYQGGSLFFKDPLKKTCEYRLNVFLEGEKISGWFKEGTDEACDQDDSDQDGERYELLRNYQPEYQGYVGLCQEAYNGCTLFLDYDPSFVKNGGFEAWSDDVPSFWNILGASRAESGDIQGGEFALKMLYDPNESNLVYQTIKDLKRGKLYLINLWFKSGESTKGECGDETPEDPPQAQVKLFKGEGKTQGDPLVEKTFSGNDFWQKISLNYSPEEEVEDLTLVLYGPKEGCSYNQEQPTYILYDDLEVKEYRDIPYTYLDNRRLDRSSCPEEDWLKGCVRFYNTNLDKQTYEIIKVEKDRICGEWLMKKDEGTLGLCEEFVEGSNTECKRWVKEDEAHLLDLSDNSDYLGRDVAWRYGDYSGFSIPNFDSLALLNQAPEIQKLPQANASGLCRAYPQAEAPFPQVVEEKEGFAIVNLCYEKDYACECDYRKIQAGAYKLYTSRGYKAGRCFTNACQKDSDCDTSEGAGDGKCLEGICVEGNKSSKTENYCDRDEDCEIEERCVLKRCSQGTNLGQPCFKNEECGSVETGATCSYVSKVESYKGKWGFCLEYDTSVTRDGYPLGSDEPPEKNYPCLTWFPFKTCVAGDSALIGTICEDKFDCGLNGRCE